MNRTAYFYLHGFASGPQSAKAKVVGDRCRQLAIPLTLPDLNQDDFYHLTLTRQITQVRSAFPDPSIPVTLIGSSFGGLTAAWLAEQCPQVHRLVLLAPAFGFLAHWLPKLGPDQLQHWQTQGHLSVYHYAYQRYLPLSYNFVTDLQGYADHQLQRPLPTLILHGRQDEVIPVQASQAYAQRRSWVELRELDSDHALGNVHPEILAAIEAFCGLSR